MFYLKWRLAPVLFLFLLPVLAQAQTAADMDALLETQAVNAAQAARFVLEAADLLPAGLSGAEAESAAYDLAKSKGWTSLASGDEVTLKDAAFLIMSAFDIEGGFMYALFPGPRYAYREMVYRKLIQGRADPAMPVSGSRLLQIIGRTLNQTASAPVPPGSQGIAPSMHR